MERKLYEQYLEIMKQIEAVARARLRTKFVFKIVPAEDFVEVYYLPQSGFLDERELIDETKTHNIKYFTLEEFLGD